MIGTMDCFGSIMYNGFEVKDSMKVSECFEGSENKFFINFKDDRYLVKDSSFNRRRKQPSLAPFCEYVGSNFIRFSGLLPCQTCFLGTYQGRNVVICVDLFKNTIFRPFKELHQSSAGTDLSNKLYTYADVLHVLKKKSELDNSRFADFKSRFWLMFLLDTVLGNRDRHEGNWGFIKEKGITKLAPIFDNGSSLFPDVNLTNWNDYDFIYDRVFKLPGSQLKMWKEGIEDRPMRTNYYEIISQYSEEFSDELDMVRALDFNLTMKRALTDVPDFCYDWFKTIAKFRFECLINGREFNHVWEDYQNDWNREY